jgi:hypothetical protein
MMILFAQGYKDKGHFALGMRVGIGTKWVAGTAFAVPRRDTAVSVVQAVLEGPEGRVGGLVKDLLVGRR